MPLSTRRTTRFALAAIVVLTVVHASGSSASAPSLKGGLEQLAGLAGCVGNTGEKDGCASGRAVKGATAVAVSPDGRNLYMATPDGAVAVFARSQHTARLRQLPGREACVAEAGATGCKDGRSLLGARSIAISPDGRHLYVRAEGAVAVLVRDRATGRLSQPAGPAGCLSRSGQSGCATARALDGASGITVSPDGRSVYAASDEGIAALQRDQATGSLSQPPGAAGCVTESGSAGCATGVGVARSISVAVSPDGRSLYTGSFGGTLAVLTRDQGTGALAQLPLPGGCLTDSDPTRPPQCTRVGSSIGSIQVAISPDAKTVYASSSGAAVGPRSSAVFVLPRDQGTGALRIPANPRERCVGYSPGTFCRIVTGLLNPTGLVPSQDGRRVYVTGFAEREPIDPAGEPQFPGLVAVLDRDPATGELSQAAGRQGCVGGLVRTEHKPSGPCSAVLRGPSAAGVAVSPDGYSVYVAGNAVAVLVRPIVRFSSRRAVLRRGVVRIALRCLAERPGRCKVRLSLRRSGPRCKRRSPLAVRRFSIPAQRRRVLALRVSRCGRRSITRRRGLAVKAVTTANDGIGHTHATKVRLVVRAAQRRR